MVHRPQEKLSNFFITEKSHFFIIFCKIKIQKKFSNWKNLIFRKNSKCFSRSNSSLLVSYCFYSQKAFKKQKKIGVLDLKKNLEFFLLLKNHVFLQTSEKIIKLGKSHFSKKFSLIKNCKI